MAKMITLFGKDISELNFNELKRERRCHTFLLTRVKMLLSHELAELEKFPDSQVRQDKARFFEMYKQHLEAIIQECDFYMARRFEPESNAYHRNTKKQIRKANERRRKNQILDNARAYKFNNQQGFEVSWDRDKFFLIANDRGYQTEEAVVSMVGKELRLDRFKAKLTLEDGKFTWGQVLVLGAFMEMTPKEFCDTFLAGYFVEAFGEFRADYEHINKEALLKRARKENPLFDIPKTEIEVGSDGAPIDEEEWFD